MNAVYDSAAAVEVAFYSAFERADFPGMMAVWAADESVFCVHPLGQLLVGHDAVAASWLALFEHGPGMRFTIRPEQIIATAELEIRIVAEIIHVPREPQPRPPMIASNAYRRIGPGWRMVSHHASPSPEHFGVAPAPASRAVH
jgi:ketosteroid isomerase-like protein